MAAQLICVYPIGCGGSLFMWSSRHGSISTLCLGFRLSFNYERCACTVHSSDGGQGGSHRGPAGAQHLPPPPRAPRLVSPSVRRPPPSRCRLLHGSVACPAPSLSHLFYVRLSTFQLLIPNVLTYSPGTLVNALRRGKAVAVVTEPLSSCHSFLLK